MLGCFSSTKRFSLLSHTGLCLIHNAQIFLHVTQAQDPDWLQASFLEIYNEEIRDLLATEKNLKYDVKMTDSKGSDIYVTNLKVSTIVILVVNLTLVLSFLNTIHVTHKLYTRIKIFVVETGSKYITMTFLLP